MKQALLIAAAGMAGFCGGILGTEVMRAREQSHPPELIRARGFELVDKTGDVISCWGLDKNQNIVLAFGEHWPDRPGGRRPLPGDPRLGLKDPRNRLAWIGVVGDSPMLEFRCADGTERARLLLSDYGKPTLLMNDETGMGLLLGIEQSDTPGPSDNDWSLAFFPERARIGIYTEKSGGIRYVRGSFAVNNDRLKYP